MKLNKPLIVAVTAFDGLLVILGMYLIQQGWTTLAIVLFVTGGLLVGTTVVVLSRVAQAREQQHPFKTALRVARLARHPTEAVGLAAHNVLRRFPELGEVQSIDKLHAGQTQAGPVFAGSYRLHGISVSSGYFLAAILNLRNDPNLALAKLLKSPQEFDMALQLNIRETPSEVQAALVRLPYESRCAENFVLLTFTEDDVRANDFGTKVHEVIAALSGSMA